MRKLVAIIITTVIFRATTASANPTQTGVTGLLNVPTAETLDSGNICVGIWGNYRKNNSSSAAKDAFILPATITLGLSPFWEFYGTYPNLLFNAKEEASGRGTADLGTKIRFWGKRNSSFKLAADLFAQRHISEDQTIDGTLDKGARLIASLKSDRLGVHVYGGYLSTEKPAGFDFQDELLYGGGVEFSPSARTRVTIEVMGNTNRVKTLDNPLEGSLGLQYFISPHLTLNLAGGVGFSNASPDWRALIGFSTCQGVGTYIKAVPKLAQEPDSGAAKRPEIKAVKIIPLSPLLLQSAPPVVPANTLEIPLESATEEVTIKPYGQITIPPPITSGISQPLSQEVPLTPNGLTPAEGGSPLYAVDVKGVAPVAALAATASLSEKTAVYRKFRFPDIAFDYDQWSISEEGKKYLAEVAAEIRNDKKWAYLRVDGYSDNIGSENYNMDISLKRAISVAGYLINKEGVDPARIFVKGMGEAKPLADNSITEGRRFNRRCEVLFLVPK